MWGKTEHGHRTIIIVICNAPAVFTCHFLEEFMNMLNVSAEHIDDIAIIECRGTLQRTHEELLHNLVENSYVQGAKAVLLDWSEVSYFDSMGLECLIALHKKSVKHHGGLLAVMITDKVLSKVYKTLRFDTIVPLFNNRQKALEAMRIRIAQLESSNKMHAR